MSALDRFFAPESIAVIGASPDIKRIRGTLLHVLRQNAYPGKLYPVNPSYKEIDGLACYPNVKAIGAPVDLAVVVIPAPHVPAALEECAACGVRYAVIISSGFAEEGEAQGALQEEIVRTARRSGMRISGPNGEGFHNDIARVSATFSPAVESRAFTEAPTATSRRIGVVAQSGGIGFSFYMRGRAIGLSFSTIVTSGNEADLTATDFFAHMVEDEATSAILLFLETVRDADRFLAAAQRAAEVGKPVVAIKIGRSEAGRRATTSHTASMAGWDTAFDAVFRRYGITVASDPDEAMAILAAFTTAPLPRGRRAAVVTTSGGAGIWVTDALAAAGYELPALSQATQDDILRFMPSYGSAQNPVDVTAQGVYSGGLRRAIELLSEGDEVDLIVPVLSMASETRIAVDPETLAPLLAAQKKPVLFYTYTIPSALYRETMAKMGAVILTGMSALTAAARAVAERAEFEPPRPFVAPASIRIEGAAGPLTEHESKELLATHGLSIAPRRLVRNAGELERAARDLGFPIALKVQSRKLPHKTEAGGVRLGLADAVSLRAAWDDMLATVAKRSPEAPIDGVLVEKMAARGVEVIVGIVRDEVFGPMVMVGAGGVTAELFGDASWRPAPVDEIEAQTMLRELKSAPLLEGFRGTPKADVAALAKLVAQLSSFAAAARDSVREVELNPVIVHEEGRGCTIADALVVLSGE
jgi:acetate---CoA ligase (ADP-forming)